MVCLKLLITTNLSPLASNMWNIFLIWNISNIWNIFNTWNIFNIWNMVNIWPVSRHVRVAGFLVSEWIQCRPPSTSTGASSQQHLPR